MTALDTALIALTTPGTDDSLTLSLIKFGETSLCFEARRGDWELTVPVEQPNASTLNGPGLSSVTPAELLDLAALMSDPRVIGFLKALD